MKNYVVILSVLLACGDKEEQTAPALNNGGSSNTDSCGGTSPVVQSVTCENSGIQEHPDYGELPTFSLYVSAIDEDADLTYYELFVDIDSELDGEKATDAIPLDPVQGVLSDDTCDVSSANVGLTIYMRSGPPEFSTTYEWYIQVADALGSISEPYMVQCTTPDEDGIGEVDLGE